MSKSATNTLMIITIVVWIFTLTRSLLIMFSGNKIFDKARKGKKIAYYPILNLFSMLEVAEVSTYYGILLFVPYVNLIVLAVMSLNLGKMFKVSSGFKAGLVFLPIVFYPMLAKSDKPYKMSDEDYFRALDSARGESINLMTEEEVKAENTAPVEALPQIDSIFKTKIDTMEDAAPYKAAKIDSDTLNKMNDLAVEDEFFSPIKRVEEIPSGNNSSSNNTEENDKEQSKFIGELKKEEEVEFIDL